MYVRIENLKSYKTFYSSVKSRDEHGRESENNAIFTVVGAFGVMTKEYVPTCYFSETILWN